MSSTFLKRASFAFVAALVILVPVSGCGREPTPSPQVTGSAPADTASAAVPLAASPVPTAEASGAPPGTLTCSRLGTAIQRANLMDPGVVDAIVAASATADAPVADAAQRLATAYAAAVAARGTDREPDAVAAVSAAAADMNGVCDESGLETTG